MAKLWPKDLQTQVDVFRKAATSPEMLGSLTQADVARFMDELEAAWRRGIDETQRLSDKLDDAQLSLRRQDKGLGAKLATATEQLRDAVGALHVQRAAADRYRDIIDAAIARELLAQARPPAGKEASERWQVARARLHHRTRLLGRTLLDVQVDP